MGKNSKFTGEKQVALKLAGRQGQVLPAKWSKGCFNGFLQWKALGFRVEKFVLTSGFSDLKLPDRHLRKRSSLGKGQIAGNCGVQWVSEVPDSSSRMVVDNATRLDLTVDATP